MDILHIVMTALIKNAFTFNDNFSLRHNFSIYLLSVLLRDTIRTWDMIIFISFSSLSFIIYKATNGQNIIVVDYTLLTLQENNFNLPYCF